MGPRYHILALSASRSKKSAADIDAALLGVSVVEAAVGEQRDQFVTRADLELLEDRRELISHRAQRATAASGDLRIRQTGAHEVDDRALRRGQQRERAIAASRDAKDDDVVVVLGERENTRL
jgi:hypothetical protein